LYGLLTFPDRPKALAELERDLAEAKICGEKGKKKWRKWRRLLLPSAFKVMYVVTVIYLLLLETWKQSFQCIGHLQIKFRYLASLHGGRNQR